MSRLVLLLLLCVAACTNPPNRVVLLDNEDGHRSELVVTTQAGATALDKPGEAVTIGSGTSAPKEIALSETEINQVWGRAIGAQPPRPVTFLLYFNLDTTTLTEESKAYLPQVLDLIKHRPAPEVIVIGHTDRSGDPRYNYELGLRRARIVEREALAIGVPQNLIHIDSHGSADPVLPIPDLYNPKNRRVEITVR